MTDGKVVKAFSVGALETNCYLIYSRKSKEGFLIDPGAFDKRVREAISEGRIKIKNIINTHGHIDHTSGNKKFGYPILIHARDNELLRNPSKNLAFFIGLFSESPPAERLLSDGDTIAAQDLSIKVLHTPGHTPGGISLVSGDMVFTGDTLFREGIGRSDFPYSSEKELFNSVKKLMKLDDSTKVFPGHGPATTIGHERKNNPFLKAGDYQSPALGR